MSAQALIQTPKNEAYMVLRNLIRGLTEKGDVGAWLNDSVLDVRLEVGLRGDILAVTLLLGYGGPNVELRLEGRRAILRRCEAGRCSEVSYEGPESSIVFDAVAEYVEGLGLCVGGQSSV